MHGLGGNKEQKHVKTFAQSFLDHNNTVIRFDTTNTFGESDGKYENATVTNYLEDLEDVIKWAKTKDFYMEPFCLAGHSLGGICTTLYTEKNPSKVKALAPISTVVSGEISMLRDDKDFVAWKRTGWIEYRSATNPNRIKRLPWSHMEDRLKYNILTDASKLTMPILLIVGDKDKNTPIDSQKQFYDAITHDNKELHILKDAPHTFVDDVHLKQIKEIFDKWIEKSQ